MRKLQWNLLRNMPEYAEDHREVEQKPLNTHQKEYERTLYVCEADDMWVTVEQPASNQSFTINAPGRPV